MVPGVEQLLLEQDLGDKFLRGLVNKISEGMNISILAAGDLEVADLVAHFLGGLRPPLRVIVGAAFLRHLLIKELGEDVRHSKDEYVKVDMKDGMEPNDTSIEMR